MNLPDLLLFLRSHDSFNKFENYMLPKGVFINDIILASSFISPQIIIEHGSFVTNIRYSPNGVCDLDIIIVTFKKSFWPTDYLYNVIINKFKDYIPITKFDITLISPSELVCSILERTSLGESLLQGFTILFPEETNATK